MSDVAVVTSLYDAYDPLPEVVAQDGVDVDWVCVTDDPALTGDGWRMVVEPTVVSARFSAKQPKLFPWRYTDAPVSVWIDAAFQVTTATAIVELLEYGWPCAMFAHPDRDCFYDEAIALKGSHRITDVAPIVTQVAAARQQGLPPHWGLWASCLIVRRHTADMLDLSYRWLDEMHRHRDEHDQHSFVVAAWQSGIRPHTLPYLHTDNPWAAHRPSGRHFA